MILGILDELGYVSHGEGDKLLLQFIFQRYKQRSLVITSNLEFSRWVDVFGDPDWTIALLNGLKQHLHILLSDGESSCFRQTMETRGNEVLRDQT